MSFFKRLFQRSESSKDHSAGDEHLVLLEMPCGGDNMPPTEVIEEIRALEERLEEAIIRKSVGELDGDEFGNGRCWIYMYGPDARALWSVIEPVLADQESLDGAFATLRFGPPGSTEERIAISGGWH